jgi:MerR family transcriptional regulator, light-induced transcriptional regulator
MNEKKKLFTVQELASLAGVSTSALRAWERRHDFFRPQRSAAGHRLYTNEDLKLFWYVSHLRSEGWDLKQISELGREQLLEQAIQYFSAQEEAGTAIEECAAKGRPSNRRTYDTILDALAHNDFEKALRGLEKLYTVTENNIEFADACLELMTQVGEAWHNGLISIAAEHTLTARVKHLLLGLLYLKPHGAFSHSAPHVIFATLPGELHELGLLRVAVYVREWGCRVTYVGANTPVAALEEHVKLAKPSLVCVSITQAMNPAFLNQNLQKLAMSISPRVPTVVGGSGIKIVSRTIPELRSLKLLESMEDLKKIIDGLKGDDNTLSPPPLEKARRG